MILFDTSVLISARESLELWSAVLPDEIPVFSAISYGELAFGVSVAADAHARAERQENLNWIESLAPRWLPYDRRAAAGYGVLAATVKRHRPAHARSKDIMLAGHAFALGASLATLNPKDFELVADVVPIISPASR
ncbi:hypothetical protein GCM10022287_01220 [Gryllotalpicola koreensis]|uniref:PIN domain-containing protein n=1 Tax=Gryllotalpicola koreensis TaxID=993086 RepID=A0ABP7ZQE5_9MICO